MTIAAQFEIASALRSVPDKDVFYEASHLNGNGRATDGEMAIRYEALRRIVREIEPCSVRGAFYQASVRGIVEKDEAGYERVQRALVKMREYKLIPHRWITDNTRWTIRPTTHNNLADALEEFKRGYRRAIWRDVPAHVEVWIEKDALAGVIHPVIDTWDVPLMVARGFASISFLYSAAQDIIADDKPAFVYHLGDLDPSGLSAAESIERGLRGYAPAVEIRFERLAVLPHQIEEYGLPTRPTKRSTHAKKWTGRDSVELDAIDPRVLRSLVREAIEQHLPTGHLEQLELVEAEERRMLEMFAAETWQNRPLAEREDRTME